MPKMRSQPAERRPDAAETRTEIHRFTVIHNQWSESTTPLQTANLKAVVKV